MTYFTRTSRLYLIQWCLYHPLTSPGYSACFYCLYLMQQCLHRPHVHLPSTNFYRLYWGCPSIAHLAYRRPSTSPGHVACFYCLYLTWRFLNCHLAVFPHRFLCLLTVACIWYSNPKPLVLLSSSFLVTKIGMLNSHIAVFVFTHIAVAFTQISIIKFFRSCTVVAHSTYLSPTLLIVTHRHHQDLLLVFIASI